MIRSRSASPHPREVPIYRKEVYLQIQEANKAAVDAEGMAALKNLLG